MKLPIKKVVYQKKQSTSTGLFSIEKIMTIDGKVVKMSTVKKRVFASDVDDLIYQLERKKQKT